MRSTLDRTTIVVAPLSGKPMVVRMSKKDPRVALEKRDCESEFLQAVVDYVGVGNELRFSRGDGKSYVLTLVEDPARIDAALGESHD